MAASAFTAAVQASAVAGAAFTAAVQATPVVIWSGGISQHADQWKWAVWCEDGSVGGAPGTIQPCPPGASGPRTSARKLFLEGEHCEDLAKSAPCPDSWYGFLKVAGDRYVVSLPRCERFIPTRYANVRNEFSIIATTSVVRSNEHSKPLERIGAVLMRFERTTSHDAGWTGMAADEKSCTLACLTMDEESQVVRMASLVVPCPTADAPELLPDVRTCAGVGGDLLLVRAGKRMLATESSLLYGERCAFAPPEPPESLLADGTTTAVALAWTFLGKYVALAWLWWLDRRRRDLEPANT